MRHVPLVRENYVLWLRGDARGIVSTTTTCAVLPAVVARWQRHAARLPQLAIRDRTAALTTAELRWIPNRNVVDVALFYDAGMVAPAFCDLCLSAVSAGTSASASVFARAGPRRCESSWRAAMKGCASSSRGVRRSDDEADDQGPAAAGGARRRRGSRPSVLVPGADAARGRARVLPRRSARPEPDTQDASKVAEWDIDLRHRPRHQPVRPAGRQDAERPRPQRQHHRRSARFELVHQPDRRAAVSIEEAVRGPLVGAGPSPTAGR